MTNMMTPDEVREAAIPNIAAYMDQINQNLVAGKRVLFGIPAGYQSEIARRLTAAGWEVKVEVGLLYVRCQDDPLEYPFRTVKENNRRKK